MTGDMSLLQALADGLRDATRFLTVPPRYRIAASVDEDVIQAVPEG